MRTTRPQFTAKVVLLGSGAVGKTTLFYCFDEGPQNLDAQPFVQTTNGDVIKKQFHKEKGDLFIRIWDTAGQEKFRSLNTTFIKGAQGAFLLADLSTFQLKEVNGEIKEVLREELDYWLESFRKGAEMKAPVILVGNKKDLPENKKAVKVLEKFAQEHSFPFVKVSARTGEEVEGVMQKMSEMVYTTYYSNPQNDGEDVNASRLTAQSLRDQDEKQKKRKCCI